MGIITKPLLAEALLAEKDWDTVTYPVYATPKLDGIRALKIDGRVLSRSFKPIPNVHIRTYLESLIPDGFDGEIMIRNSTFEKTQGDVMRIKGEPDFYYNVFDYVLDSLDKPYIDRMNDLAVVYKSLDKTKVKALFPVKINNKDELDEFESKCLAGGYEGVMIRKPNGRYKCGRSTIKEGILLKVKRFLDDEAVVVDFEELHINNNEQTKNELGHSKRSHQQANMIPAGTLGAIVVESTKFGRFNIGSGFSELLRKEIWDNRDLYKGRLVTFKYQPVGIKDKPRFPVYKGFRSSDDL